MVLEWTPSLLQDQPFSAAATVYISREAWETQNHHADIFQHQSTWYLRTREQETHTIILEALHDRPFSVRDSD